MSTNAKNRLLELYQANGWHLDWTGMFKREATGLSGGWKSTIDHTMPDGRRLVGTGEANRASQADIGAVAAALCDLDTYDDEPEVMADAQPGDALIKLAAYLTMADASPEERSDWLQKNETDPRLAALFDRLWDVGDPDVRKYGRGRGEKYKASVVEALIWRRFRDQVLAPGAESALAQVFELVGRGGEAE